MRVEDQILNGAAGLQTGQTPPASQTERPGTAPETQPIGSAGQDRADISSLAGNLSQVLSAQSAQRTQHIQKLASDFAAGRYNPDPQAISRGIVQDAIERQDAKP